MIFSGSVLFCSAFAFGFYLFLDTPVDVKRSALVSLDIKRGFVKHLVVDFGSLLLEN